MVGHLVRHRHDRSFLVEAMTIRVAVIDDHPAIVAGVAHLLAEATDIEVVGGAATMVGGAELLDDPTLDVALVDVRLADGIGLRLIERTREIDGPAVLVYSTFPYDQFVAAAVRAGAAGFVLKTADRAELEAAVRHAAFGQTWFTADHLRVARRSTALSSRERRIVELVIASRTNDEIARELGLSPKTVESALTLLFDRHGIGDRIELAVRASTEGWLDAQSGASQSSP
jgi:DNA-binding NarL/FixJ family response regulator